MVQTPTPSLGVYCRPKGHAPGLYQLSTIRPVPQLSDDDLATSFVAGEPEALRRIYEEHHRAVFSYCRRFVADQAPDVTQEVFLAAWRSRHGFDPASGSLGGWLMGIARFKVIDHLRGMYRNGSVPSSNLIDLSADGGAGEREIDLVATQMLAAEVLEALDEPAGTWVRMAYLEGRSHSEIADVVGAPLGTVKSTIRRSLQRVRRELEAFDDRR